MSVSAKQRPNIWVTTVFWKYAHSCTRQWIKAPSTISRVTSKENIHINVIVQWQNVIIFGSTISKSSILFTIVSIINMDQKNLLFQIILVSDTHWTNDTIYKCFLWKFPCPIVHTHWKNMLGGRISDIWVGAQLRYCEVHWTCQRLYMRWKPF